jgi:hypothetical protein
VTDWQGFRCNQSCLKASIPLHQLQYLKIMIQSKSILLTNVANILLTVTIWWSTEESMLRMVVIWLKRVLIANMLVPRHSGTLKLRS